MFAKCEKEEKKYFPDRRVKERSVFSNPSLKDKERNGTGETLMAHAVQTSIILRIPVEKSNDFLQNP